MTDCGYSKNKMCTSGIDHTSNGYYYEVISMRTIFFLRQGRDEPMEAYYRRFESAISTAELAKFTATTHAELNITYAVGDGNDGNRRFQEM